MNTAHMAKYLVLVGHRVAPRALLFSGEHRYLAELIDHDGLILENLVRTSTSCAAPADLALDAVHPASASAPGMVQCYALG